MNRLLKKATVFIAAIFNFCILNAEIGRKIIFPDVPGYYVLTGDFHIHTVFSDAVTWPTERVDEAVYDGTEVLSITDHVDSKNQKYLKSEIFNCEKVDRNTSFEMASEYAKSHGVIVIHGGELSRGKRLFPGHFNIHFINDGNLICKCAEEAASKENNPIKAEQAAVIAGLTEAKRQNAFIVWNHPSWERQAPSGPQWNEFYDKLLSEGLLDGIEVVNYSVSELLDEPAFNWALEKNLTIVSGTDCHRPMYKIVDVEAGAYRSETLVFSKEKSADGVREALNNHRTLVVTNNHIYGDSNLLKQLFKACLSIQNVKIGKDKISAELTNVSSIPLIVRKDSEISDSYFKSHFILHPQETISVSAMSSNMSIDIFVENYLSEINKPIKTSIIFE